MLLISITEILRVLVAVNADRATEVVREQSFFILRTARGYSTAYFNIFLRKLPHVFL